MVTNNKNMINKYTKVLKLPLPLELQMCKTGCHNQQMFGTVAERKKFQTITYKSLSNIVKCIYKNPEICSKLQKI